MTARYLIGDVHEQLATLEAGSVDLIVSSPPFLALRSYLPADHPDKHLEIGSERTPGEYLDTLLDVVEACDRVLAPHGSLVFELGDTYAGSGGAGGDWIEGSGQRVYKRGSEIPDFSAMPDRKGRGWPQDKCKVLIPQLFAIALSYGFNPLTGRQTPQWRVRNTVAWCRPNPPVGRDGDKYRPATSYLTIACKARDRYWDGDAVRTQLSAPERTQVVAGARIAAERFGERETAGKTMEQNPAGAPLLDWWEIPTAPYKGSHYATYPPDLIVPIIRAMCPQRVCRTCGQPSRRITSVDYDEHGASAHSYGTPQLQQVEVKASADYALQQRNENAQGMTHGRATKLSETVGWTDCHHDNWRPGHVLDPFAGSGVTGLVATGHGHDCTLIDLDSRNAELALERVGPMLLTVEGMT